MEIGRVRKRVRKKKRKKNGIEYILWSRITKNRDVSTAPLTRPFACTAHLLRLLACSLARLLAHYRARGKVDYSWWKIRLFWTIVEWKAWKSKAADKIYSRLESHLI